jgi:hypothetical protein
MRAVLTSEDFASAGFALDAGFFAALEALVLLARSDLFVPTGYLFLFSTVWPGRPRAPPGAHGVDRGE